LSAFEDLPIQPDHVEGWAIHYIIIGIAVTIFACLFIVWLFLLDGLAGGGRSDVVVLRTVPPATSFLSITPLELERRAKAAQLAHWQWADAAHHRVLLPVEIAIDRYVEQRSSP